ncbi:MAG: 3-oxoacyl-ACP reductase [Brachybacterium sp.]|nr:3-oxoacyl-ACP reductase [Brachybacterium sp.]
MTDTYTRFIRSGPGRALAARTGLPQPARLPRREDRPEAVLDPVVVLGASAGADAIAEKFLHAGADVRRRFEELTRVGSVIVVIDEVEQPDQLGEILLPLAGAMRRLDAGSRVVTVSRPAVGDGTAPARDAARGGVEGFVRSLAHEMRKGGTANGILVADGVPLDAPGVRGALDFLLSARSAFVDGQFLTVTTAEGHDPEHREQPLAGRTALVTGAARGIGASIARTLAADGARVVLLDVPAAGTDLARLANEIDAIPLQLDVTAADAGDRLVAFCRTKTIVLDIVVHNAGITRDKMFANMVAARWDPVIAVNVTSQATLNEALITSREGDEQPALGADPRIVSLASTSGIAGNKGQTNYAASKAGVMALATATAAQLADRGGGTANAVAPGFIETEMTEKIPPVQREIARRANSLQQGGLPIDVAEVVAFLASGPAGGIRGETVRVCGQNLVGR